MKVNLEAEQTLLGCLFIENELVKESRLQSKHFYSTDHQVLFETIKKVDAKNEPIDFVSVITNIDQHTLQRLGGRGYLSQLVESVPSTEPFKSYERYILDAYKLRVAEQIKDQELIDPEALTKMVNELTSIDQENEVEEDYNHTAALVRLRNKLETKKEGLTGIDTGFRDLNNYLDGYKPGELIISAARPSVGKTAKALNHAIQACKKSDAVVPIFSLEMDEDSLLTRMMAAVGNIDSAKLRNPMQRFEESDWNKLSHAEGELNNMNLHIYDKSGQTVSYIRSKVRRLRNKYPDKPMLIIIDYLQLIRSTQKFERRDLEVGDITRSLKEMARDMKAPVILLSQLSRGIESRQDKRPMLSDIRDSGSVEQDADIVEFLHRDDYYDKASEKQNILEVIIAKQRNGPVGTVELAFIKEYNLFLDLEYRYEH